MEPHLVDSLVDSLVLLQEAVARVLENQPSKKLAKCNTLSTELNIFLRFILFISISLCTSIFIFIKEIFMFWDQRLYFAVRKVLKIRNVFRHVYLFVSTSHLTYLYAFLSLSPSPYFSPPLSLSLSLLTHIYFTYLCEYLEDLFRQIYQCFSFLIFRNLLAYRIVPEWSSTWW